jgi:hypothetical protein
VGKRSRDKIPSVDCRSKENIYLVYSHCSASNKSLLALYASEQYHSPKRINRWIPTKVFHSLSHVRTQSFVKTLCKNNILSAFVHIGWFLPSVQKEECLILEDPRAGCVRKTFQVGDEYTLTCKLSHAIWRSALNSIYAD